MTFSNNPPPYPEEPRDLKTAIESLRPRWLWIVGLGTLIASLGVAALILVVSATIASVYTIAIFMILAGAAEIATGLERQDVGPVFALDPCRTRLYRSRGFRACAAFGRRGLLHLGPWRWHARDRGGPHLSRTASRSAGARSRSACGRAYGPGRRVDRRWLAE